MRPITSGFLKLEKPRSTLVRLAYFSSHSGLPQKGNWKMLGISSALRVAVLMQHASSSPWLPSHTASLGSRQTGETTRTPKSRGAQDHWTPPPAPTALTAARFRAIGTSPSAPVPDSRPTSQGGAAHDLALDSDRPPGSSGAWGSSLIASSARGLVLSQFQSLKLQAQH